MELTLSYYGPIDRGVGGGGLGLGVVGDAWRRCHGEDLGDGVAGRKVGGHVNAGWWR